MDEDKKRTELTGREGEYRSGRRGIVGTGKSWGIKMTADAGGVTQRRSQTGYAPPTFPSGDVGPDLTLAIGSELSEGKYQFWRGQ